MSVEHDIITPNCVDTVTSAEHEDHLGSLVRHYSEEYATRREELSLSSHKVFLSKPLDQSYYQTLRVGGMVVVCDGDRCLGRDTLSHDLSMDR